MTERVVHAPTATNAYLHVYKGHTVYREYLKTFYSHKLSPEDHGDPVAEHQLVYISLMF